MRIAAALTLLIFAILGASVAGSNAARSELLTPITVKMPAIAAELVR